MNGMVSASEGGVNPILTGFTRDEQGHMLMVSPHTSLRTGDIWAAYRDVGDACASRLSGDFAFVLWDTHSQRLVACRSITGRCALYTTRLPWGIGWSSDPLTLQNLVSANADLMWIARWLLRSEDSWDRSPWREINPLLPGHTLIYDLSLDQLHIHPSWTPPPRLSIADLPFAEAATRFRALYLHAIVTRIGCQPQASFDCSGGLDSTSIVASVAYLQEQGMLPMQTLPVLHCYSERFPEEDGRAYLMALIKRYPTIKPYFLNYDTICLRPLVLQEQSYPSTRGILLPALFQERTRMLTSIGSLFHVSGEYGDHLFAPNIRWLWHQPLWHITQERWAWRSLPGSQRLLYKAWLSERMAHQRAQHRPAWITQEAFAYDQQCLQRHESLLKQWLPDPFQRTLLGNIYRDQALLSLGSTAHMARHSGFDQYPYLDQSLLEFMCMCPLPWLMAPWQRPKALLRVALTDILPEPIRNRMDKGNATRITAYWSQHQSAALKSLAERLTPLPFIEHDGFIAAIDRMRYGDCRDQRSIYASLALALSQKGENLDGRN